MDVTVEERWSSADDGGHGGLQLLVSAGPSRFVADEPVSHGGRNPGATPHDSFTRVITLAGGLDADQRARLLQIAEMCPVHRMLTAGSAISTSLTP